MSENYEHYISRNIQSVYRRKLFVPFVYMVLLAILWFVTPISCLLFPQKSEGYQGLMANYEAGDSYIETELHDLYFTGYTSTHFGGTSGYYYYTFLDGQCIFVLLSPSTSEQGLPYIEHARIRGKILYQGKAFEQLTQRLAEDLSWTQEGLTRKVSDLVLSEPAFHSVLSTLLLFLYFATGIYALLSYLLCILYGLFPVLSPPCRQLGRFGKATRLLSQAEEELATLPQLATEDMFITEHFFIEIADFGIAVVPIGEIIWIYKHSTLHKIFWYHFNISYTLHITANRHLHIQCPKNRKSDIDGIIDYLAEANHNVLVGFSEENRLKVQEIQGTAKIFEKLISIIKRRL